jgi:integrase/recombinase XerC
VPSSRQSRDERDLRSLVLPQVGAVTLTKDLLEPVQLLDADGAIDETVRQFVRHLVACDYSSATCRSYVLSLLRWLRFLAAVDVPWDRAERREVRDFVLWMRGADNPQRHRRPGTSPPGTINPVTGKRTLSEGYAPSTINHALSAARMFYEYHLMTGLGPLVNPVPAQRGRGFDRAGSHRSPIEPVQLLPRAPYRQRIPSPPLRALPDDVFNDFFAALSNHRDRAIVAVAVSSGARAAELLRMRLEEVDFGRQLVALQGKGHRELELVPASPDSFLWLAAYLAESEADRSSHDSRLWWTRRGPARPLTYWALRQILNRANDQLGSNVTFHDLRHTYAMRLMDDPNLFITDVQRLMRHRSLTSTQIYARAHIDELVAKMHQHYSRSKSAPAGPDPAYDPDAMAVLFPGIA